MFLTSRMSAILALTAGVAVYSCNSSAGDGKQRQLDMLVSEAPEESPTSLLAGKQRAFLQSLTDQNGDPTPFMSTRIEVVDWADPSTQPVRGLMGHVALGQDYLLTLSERLPSTYAELSSLDVQLESPDHAVIIARHPGAGPTITHWLYARGEWRVSLFFLNVPEDVLDRVRARPATQS